MEIEYFVGPEDHIWPEAQERWVSDSWAWLLKIGLREEWLRRKIHTRESGLAHYAKACTDIEFNYPFGFQVTDPLPVPCHRFSSRLFRSSWASLRGVLLTSTSMASTVASSWSTLPSIMTEGRAHQSSLFLTPSSRRLVSIGPPLASPSFVS
jgi:hypothetical protein